MGSHFSVMMENDIAVVIAGGKSSRMQRDKALLPFGGFDSLCEFQCVKLQALFSKVYVSAKSNKFNFEVEIIEDIEEESSPLVALVSIFEKLDIEQCFILSVDMPFVGEQVIQELYLNSGTEDVIVAISSKGLEPLCAIYRSSFLEEAKKALNGNQHRLQSLFEVLSVNKVVINDQKAFKNLNYPEEYEKALEMQKKKS
jgi:molybdopterin-guanine dinucleotide biosynthesis protein A